MTDVPSASTSFATSAGKPPAPVGVEATVFNQWREEADRKADRQQSSATCTRTERHYFRLFEHVTGIHIEQCTLFGAATTVGVFNICVIGAGKVVRAAGGLTLTDAERRRPSTIDHLSLSAASLSDIAAASECVCCE
jgi:hypothetical protein